MSSFILNTNELVLLLYLFELDKDDLSEKEFCYRLMYILNKIKDINIYFSFLCFGAKEHYLNIKIKSLQSELNERKIKLIALLFEYKQKQLLYIEFKHRTMDILSSEFKTYVHKNNDDILAASDILISNKENISIYDN